MNRGARQKWDVLGPADILNLRLPLVHVFFKNSVDILYSLIGRAPSQNSNECILCLCVGNKPPHLCVLCLCLETNRPPRQRQTHESNEPYSLNWENKL